jgi:hypothetical protein
MRCCIASSTTSRLTDKHNQGFVGAFQSNRRRWAAFGPPSVRRAKVSSAKGQRPNRWRTDRKLGARSARNGAWPATVKINRYYYLPVSLAQACIHMISGVTVSCAGSEAPLEI